MPTYEYICDACQHEFEKFQSIKADPISVCPECGKAHVRRKISSGAGILFKGGGFYETDYRSAGYTEAAKKEAGDGGAAKTEAKAESTAQPAKAEAPKAETPKPAPAAKPAESKPAS